MAASYASVKIEWKRFPGEDLGVHAEHWNALNRSAADLPVLDAEFFLECLRCFGTGRERLVLGYRREVPIAGAVVSRSGGVAWSTFQPSQAPLGAWVSTPEQDAVNLWSGLQRVVSPWCMVLGISQQDPLVAARPADHGAVQTLDYIETASIPVSGRFNDYWARRGRNLRQNMKRQRNLLNREGVDTRLEIVDSPERIGQAVDEYALLESSGWKSHQGTALHPENAQGRFYRALFERYAQRGEATVYRYFYGDELVATDLCLHRAGVLIILKTTHNESINRTSPTHLMRQELFEQLFDSGEFRRIEFYGKLMEWHTKWSDDIRRMYHVNCFRWPAMADFKAVLGARGKIRKTAWPVVTT